MLDIKQDVYYLNVLLIEMKSSNYTRIVRLFS